MNSYSQTETTMISAITSHFPFLRKRWPSTKTIISLYWLIRFLLSWKKRKSTLIGIYALKKEVAVSASPPHYALLAQVGSIHDYTTFKSNYECYSNYLLKTPEERNLIPTDANEPSWAILGDRGPDLDTPDLRRVKMIKNPNLKLIETPSLKRSEFRSNAGLED